MSFYSLCLRYGIQATSLALSAVEVASSENPISQGFASANIAIQAVALCLKAAFPNASEEHRDCNALADMLSGISSFCAGIAAGETARMAGRGFFSVPRTVTQATLILPAFAPHV